MLFKKSYLFLLNILLLFGLLIFFIILNLKNITSSAMNIFFDFKKILIAGLLVKIYLELKIIIAKLSSFESFSLEEPVLF